MATIKDQLLKIGEGESKPIRGVSVFHSDCEFTIADEIYSLDEAVTYITESTSKRTKGIDYANTALLIIKPPSRVISTHRVRDKKEHRKILDRAFEKQYFVYLAHIEHRDGRYYATQPWIIDWDSVDALYEIDGTPKVESKDEKQKIEDDKSNLYCPYCSHKINSTPGRTLHVKSKHPEKLEEYQEWLKSLGKN